MSRRVLEGLAAVASRHPDARERIAIVSHGGPIRAIACTAVGLPPDGRRLLANGPNGAITVVDVRPESWVLVAYNDSGHVDHLATIDRDSGALQPGTE
jgi:broad specificity phosphatase PhoE